MLSDDVFRAKRDLTIAQLRAWTGFVADVAHVETGEVGDAWRISMTPRTPAGCPVELSIRDDQKFDIRIAGETYEDRPIETLDAFLPLLEAIAEGRVVTRVMRSAMTGAVREVETIVRLANGMVFQGRSGPAGRIPLPPPLPGVTSGTEEVRDMHYLPYRRG